MKISLTPDLKTALVFFVFGCLWIILSDFIFLRLVEFDMSAYYRIQVVKGIIFVLFSALLIFYVGRMLYRDIEEKNRLVTETNIELHESVERYNMLTMATRDVIYDHNFRNGRQFVNQALTDMLGYSIPEVLSNDNWWEEHLHPQEKDRILDSRERTIQSGKIFWQEEYLFRCSDGSYKKILDRSHFLHDEEGKVYRVVSALHDVTISQKLQEQLFEQRLAHEKELSQIILSAQERERKRIALELHDNINQLLTTIKLHIDLAATSEKKEGELLTKTGSMMNHVINEVRILSRELAPSGITDLGLIDSIMDMTLAIERTGALQIEVDSTQFNEEFLSTDKKLTLYRIAQEQLNNIIRYSKASNANIRLYSTNANAQMEISDDGVGFNVHTLTPGMGFSNMRSRLEVFNGKMHLSSSPGKGCELVVSL